MRTATIHIAAVLSLLSISTAAGARNASPAASGAYWHALARMAGQQHVTIHESLTQTLVYRSPYHGPFGSRTMGTERRYLVRHAPNRTSVAVSTRGGYPLALPLSMIMAGRTFCIGPDFHETASDSGWVCSPAHSVSVA